MVDENIIKALDNSFSPSVQQIYVSSIGRNVMFREPNIREQKTVSKIIISNSDRQSLIYATTLAMIKSLCLEDDFSQYDINEYDRLNILAHLFSSNFFSKKFTINCPNHRCKESFPYKVMHGDILREMNKIDSTNDIEISAKNNIGEITVYANFPSCRRYLDFLDFLDNQTIASDTQSVRTDKYDMLNNSFSDMEKISDASDDNGGSSVNIENIKIAEMIKAKKERNKKNTATHIDKASENFADFMNFSALNEYTILDVIDIFIKKIKYRINGSDDTIEVNFEGFDFKDTETILGKFPAAIFIDDSDGKNMLDKIAFEISKKTKNAIPYIKCPKCGFDISKNLHLNDFFTFG